MARNSEGKDLPTQIYNDIKKRILSLELEPGRAFCEADVCERYNTSRTPAKSALNRLADEGYIDVTPYQTTRVALIDADKVRQFLYGRVAIEERVLMDFIKGGGLMQLEDVEHSIRKQEIVISDKPVDALTFHELDKAYHGIWYKAVDKMRIWNQLCSSIDYTRLKIEKAKQLLREGMAVKQVAAALCFDTPEHFSKTFKKYAASTPARYKKMHFN